MSALGIRLGLGTPGPGAWWPEGVGFAADFRGRRYMAGGRGRMFGEVMSFARSSRATAMNPAGLCLDFAPAAPRFTDAGLLLEDEARNVLRRSSGLGVSGAWTAEGNAAAAGNTAGFGVLVMEECAVVEPGDFPRFLSTDTLTLAHGEYGVISLHAIAGAASSIRTAVSDGSGMTATGWTVGGDGFVRDGAVADNPAVTEHVADGIERFGNGLCRLWTAFRNVSGAPLAYRAALYVQGTTDAPAMASACWLGGIQLEKGRWPTSLIVTAGAAVTRAADRLSMTPAMAGLGSAPCFAFAMRWLGGDPAFPWLFNLSDGTSSNEIGIYVNVGQSSLNRRVVAGGVIQTDGSGGVANLAYGDHIAAAMRVANNDLKTYARRNGGAVVETNGGSIVLPSFSELLVGARQGGGGRSALMIERLAGGKNLTNGQLEGLVLS